MTRAAKVGFDVSAITISQSKKVNFGYGELSETQIGAEVGSGDRLKEF